jgi:hypothetical protein
VIVDVDTGASIAAEVIPANTNDKKLFMPLYNKVFRKIGLYIRNTSNQ